MKKRASEILQMKRIILFVQLSFIILLFNIPGFAQTSINRVDVNTNPVGKYEKLELTVSLTASYSNHFDPDDIDFWAIFTSPNLIEWNIKGFWDGSNWKIRFAANETGTWSYIVHVDDGSGQASTTPANFSCVSSSHPGWLRVSSSDPHFLCHDNDASFFGIGQCRCWNLDDVPTIFTDMQSHNMNMLVYWMPSWDNLLVTTDYNETVTPRMPIAFHYDTYDMTRAANIDAVVENCEQHDIYLMLTIWNHDELRGNGHSWPRHYFDGTNGSPAVYNPFYDLTPSANNFFSDATSWTYQQKLYRYIIARWGYSRAIGLWHLICEIDGTSNSYNNDAVTDPWHSNKINQYFKNNDPFGHPTTASKSSSPWWWPNGFSVTDVPQVHTYENSEVTIADRIAYRTREVWNNYNKPNVIGEFGDNGNGNNKQPTHLHNGIWAGFASGAAIAPLDWNDGGSWADFTSEMYDHCLYLTNFISDIQFDQLGLSPATISINSEFKGWGMKSNELSYLWVQDASPGEVNSGTQITISSLTNGQWQLRWYNTWTGSYVGDPITATCSGGSITTTIPDFSKDIACKFQYQGSGTAAPTVTSIRIVNSNQLRLDWTEVSGATYNVYRSTDPYFTPTTPLVSGLTSLNYTDTSPGIVGDPNNNYFYVVTAVVSSVESDPSNRVGEFDFELITTSTTDVNGISLPLDTQYSNNPITMTADGLGSAIPNCDVVSRWDTPGQGYVSHIVGSASNNFQVQVGYPYFVSVTANAIWTITGGAPSSPTFNLITTATTDVNGITLPLNRGDLTTAEALGQDVPDCDVVSYWNNSGQGYVSHIVGSASNNFSTKIGYPYFVSVTANGIWP